MSGPVSDRERSEGCPDGFDCTSDPCWHRLNPRSPRTVADYIREGYSLQGFVNAVGWPVGTPLSALVVLQPGMKAIRPMGVDSANFVECINEPPGYRGYVVVAERST